jgi:dUTP pyrophosphatase
MSQTFNKNRKTITIMKQLTMKEKIAALEKASKKLNKKADLQVKIKKLHPYAVVPSYAHSTDCGLDLIAVSKTFDEYGNVVYGFGLAFEIPEGYAGFIFPRSSNHKSGLLLTNSVGVIDAGFRGEVTAKFATRKWTTQPEKLIERIRYFIKGDYSGRLNSFAIFNERNYEIGDRVAQMVILPYPKVEFVEVDELSDTERGTGGYGSTGR